MSNYADVLRERAREAAEREEAFLPAPLSDIEIKNRENLNRWRERRYRVSLAETDTRVFPSMWDNIRREMLEFRSFFSRLGT